MAYDEASVAILKAVLFGAAESHERDSPAQRAFFWIFIVTNSGEREEIDAKYFGFSGVEIREAARIGVTTANPIRVDDVSHATG